MMEQFEQTVVGSLQIAQSEALNRKNTELDALHLLLGFIKNPQSYAHRSLDKYKAAVLSKIDKLPTFKDSKLNKEHLNPSAGLSQWITLASSRAVETSRSQATEGDFLRFIVKVFPDLDINPNDLKELEDNETKVPDFLVNLNEMAENGKLDPVIGRAKEIRAVMEILGRRSKNNPILVGEAGVGKTAIVEGLAEQIVKGKVPDALKGKIVYSLDLGQLMAGTKFRGEFEERMQHLLKFVKEQNGDVILFIDEIHQIVGAGKTEGAMDAANLLKPALARGELHCIGATTHDEFQKHILKDPALERRFRAVTVNKPTPEDAIEILMGLKDKFEMHHGIQISDEAIYNAVFLSEQYITNKNLPDKAIDLIDEASSALKLSAEAMPSELVELEAEIHSKKIYSKVEKNNKDILKEIDQLSEKFKSAKAIWEKDVMSLKQVSELKNKIDRYRFELEQANIKQDYELASKLKYSIIPESEKQLEAISHNWVLNVDHVANVIARQTGIPLEKILKSKQDNVLELEKFLTQRVFGQNTALTEIAETLQTSHAGLSDPTRPLGSFLLLGPSGVGKTETAKALSQFFFNNEDNIVRVDLSEYSEKHSVSKLIGAPSGYVGYEEGGILTEAIRKKPYAIILFDELEKAHKDFADILLQILDDGRLTDNKGRTIDFKNTTIIVTSNSKAPEIDFKPEVLGRFDSILNYKHLDASIMDRLIDKQIKLLNERIKEKNVTIVLEDSAKEFLKVQGFNEAFGARPLNSAFQRIIVRPLSRKLLEGNLTSGTLTATYTNNTLNFQ